MAGLVLASMILAPGAAQALSLRAPAAAGVGAPAGVAPAAALPAATTTIQDSLYVPVDPVRVMSMVPMSSASTYTLTIPNVPAGATAVQLNVTSTFVTSVSYISACAAGTPTATCAATSALNPNPGVDSASSVLVALGGAAKNQVTFYNNRGNLSLIADLQGFYVPSGGAQFVPQAPARAASLTLGAKQSTTVTLPNVPAGATAVALNVTSTQTSVSSYVSVCPAGLALATCTRSSTMNPTRGRDVANFAVVKLGGPAGNQLTVYNNAGATAVLLDVNGYFDTGTVAADAGLFRPVTPARVMNFQPMTAAGTYTLTLPNVPVGATSVAMNLTSTRTTAVSYVSACPAGTALAECRATSASNPLPGVDTANNVMLELGGPNLNQVVVYNNRGTTSLIGDVQGYFVKEGSPAGTAPTAPVPVAPPTGGQPGPTNTGAPTGLSLLPYYGDMVITTPGTVIDGMDIHGFVTIKAANVTIRNSIVRGSGPGTTNTGLINCNHSAVSNALIENVTLVPNAPSIWLSGVIGHDFTARRVNAYHVVDGFNVYNTNAPTANVLIESSYVHDLSYFSPDPNHSDNKTHNDGIQIQGGSNIQVLNNTFSQLLSTSVGTQSYPYREAGFALIVTPNVSPVTGVTVTGNWFSGGHVTVKLSTTTKFGAMTLGTVSNNYFGRDARSGVELLRSPNLTVAASGNVFADNGAAVPMEIETS